MTDNDLSPAQTRSYLHGLAELSGKSDADKPAWLQATPDDGRRNKRSNTKRVQLERGAQAEIIRLSRTHQDPLMRLLRSNANESLYTTLGYSCGITREQVGLLQAQQKVLGLRAGVPDLELNVPSRAYHGWFGELKRAEVRAQDKLDPETGAIVRRGKILKPHGVISDVQVDYHAELRMQGYRVDVIYSIKECIDAIEFYLDIPHDESMDIDGEFGR